MSEDDGRHTREERSADSQGSRGGAAPEASAASVGEYKAWGGGAATVERHAPVPDIPRDRRSMLHDDTMM